MISAYPAGSLLKWIDNSSDCVVFKHRGRDEPLLKQIRCFLSTRGVNVPMKRALRGHAVLRSSLLTNKQCLLKRKTSFSLPTLFLVAVSSAVTGSANGAPSEFVFRAPMHFCRDVTLFEASIRGAN